MDKLLDKISSYNIINNLIPGAVFIWINGLLDIFILPLDGIVEKLFIYYFCGMIVSRVGSLVVEKFCLKAKLVTYAPKKDYVVATKKDKTIEPLLETGNLYRTCAGLFLTLGICKIYTLVVSCIHLPKVIASWIVIAVLFVLFVSSFCKQTRHILSRIEAARYIEKGNGDNDGPT